MRFGWGIVRARFRGEDRRLVAGLRAGRLSLSFARRAARDLHIGEDDRARSFSPFATTPCSLICDHALHGGDAWRLLTWMNPLTDLLQPLYSAFWLLLVAAVTAFVALAPISERLKKQYAWTFTLSWVLLGNVLSSLILAAGPAYYAQVTGAERYGALIAHLREHAGAFSASTSRLISGPPMPIAASGSPAASRPFRACTCRSPRSSS